MNVHVMYNNMNNDKRDIGQIRTRKFVLQILYYTLYLNVDTDLGHVG